MLEPTVSPAVVNAYIITYDASRRLHGDVCQSIDNIYLVMISLEFGYEYEFGMKRDVRDKYMPCFPG